MKTKKKLGMRQYTPVMIPVHYVCAIINGDHSGLTDTEDALLQQWYETLPPRSWVALPPDPIDHEFRYTNDIDRLGCDCVRLILVQEI